MGKHTPGPWKVRGNVLEGAIGVVQFEGLLVAVARYSHNPRITIDEAQANAHLIASAPELLEALKELKRLDEDFRQFDKGGKPENYAAWVEERHKARKNRDAAIAKAEGRA